MPDLDPVFTALSSILRRHAASLECTADTPTELCFDTRHVMPNKKPLFFGAVQVKKSYVSYHLMPLYSDPDLKALASLELLKRMQGKSCFNFKSADPALFAELAALTEAGFERYRERGYLDE